MNARDRAVERLALELAAASLGRGFPNDEPDVTDAQFGVSWPDWRETAMPYARRLLDRLGLFAVDADAVATALGRCGCGADPGRWCSSCTARDAIADAVLAQIPSPPESTYLVAIEMRRTGERVRAQRTTLLDPTEGVTRRQLSVGPMFEPEWAFTCVVRARSEADAIAEARRRVQP